MRPSARASVARRARGRDRRSPCPAARRRCPRPPLRTEPRRDSGTVRRRRCSARAAPLGSARRFPAAHRAPGDPGAPRAGHRRCRARASRSSSRGSRLGTPRPLAAGVPRFVGTDCASPLSDTNLTWQARLGGACGALGSLFVKCASWETSQARAEAVDESSTESVFLRPTTSQTASTVSSPMVANRCGCVQSSEIVSPGPARSFRSRSRR